MNSKVVLGLLGGLLAATIVYTALFYVQIQRNARVHAETPVTVIPPSPFPQAPIPPAKAIAAKKTVAVKKQPPIPAPVDQARIEAPPVPDPLPAAVPVITPEPLPPAPPVVETIPEPPQPRSVTIAPGTLLTVRLSETVSSEHNQSGDTFAATLDQPLVIDGLVIAERGARATGRLVDVVEAGRVKGLAHLSLELTSLMSSDGQKLEVRTARFKQEGPASKAEDAQKIGIGAAIGAAIGAIAGGGKGAAIGAASGGAAGGGVAVATRGKPAMLPAETKISFRVDQALTITEKR